MDAPPQRLQPLRILLAVLLYAVAGAVAAVILIGRRDPIGVGATVGTIAEVAWTVAVYVVITATVLALFWPPFLPWLRVKWREVHDNVDHDAALLREAASRLQHFDNAPDRLTLGKELVARRDFARAIPQLVRAVELDPESLTAQQLLGRALLGHGEAEKAATLLRAVVERDEDHAFGDSLKVLGEALIASGHDDEAERVLARHEEKFGPLRSVDFLRAQIAHRRGDTARARDLFERAAAPRDGKRKLPPEEALARGRARVRLWFGGGGR